MADDDDYVELKKKVEENQSKFPDIKIVDKYVYYRTQHYSGIEDQEEQSWKLWIPLMLRKEVISKAHDTTVTAHGGMGKLWICYEGTYIGLEWYRTLETMREIVKFAKPQNLQTP